MSERRFILCQDDLGNYEIRYDDKVFHFLWEVAPILNEQQATITKLKELNGDKGKRIISLIRTNKTLKEENEQLKKARDESDKFIVKKGLEVEFLNWCVANA